jgi:hypothetical protein
MIIKNERIGLQNKNRFGENMTIVAYRGVNDIDLLLEDGTLLQNKTFGNFKKGTISKGINNRIGQQKINKKGLLMTIKSYNSADNINVEFEDGTVVKNKSYYCFNKGSIKKPSNKIGEEIITNEGYYAKIIGYEGANKIDVEIDYGKVVVKTTYSAFKKGSIKNPLHPSVCGIGYFGSGKYRAKINKKFTKHYEIWYDMIRRCYNEKRQEIQPTYKGVTVCEEWHNFQNFAKWFEDKYIEGFHLDKDILAKGNKVYSPDTCCFVPQQINNLFLKAKKTDTKRLGILQVNKSYVVRVSTIHGRAYIGKFSTLKEAQKAYSNGKKIHAKELAEFFKDKIEDRLYKALITYSSV